jgi:hypothetical protein
LLIFTSCGAVDDFKGDISGTKIPIRYDKPYEIVYQPVDALSLTNERLDELAEILRTRLTFEIVKDINVGVNYNKCQIALSFSLVRGYPLNAVDLAVKLCRPGELIFAEGNLENSEPNITSYLLGESAAGIIFTGEDVENAGNVQHEQNGVVYYGVGLELTDNGKQAFAKATDVLSKKAAPENTLSIWLDNVFLTSQTVTKEFTDGRTIISGASLKTSNDAERLAGIIALGKLPYKLKFVSIQ